ncbi:hypothetical protein BCR35DRAFT_226354 [Leucosporidium creatinivorum]|uniref:ATP synthase complex subunit H-domain-containing protein n=1 Tax=Leucosporidium creatinivorum TaxID=106004 RepID=A0A1Y2D550_9BASI|nr:hypothetical protein BCR35DRAFT_226354 [Leucosporidium creatinivorum]
MFAARRLTQAARPLVRSFSVGAPARKDFVQDLYLKELKAYKPSAAVRFSLSLLSARGNRALPLLIYLLPSLACRSFSECGGGAYLCTKADLCPPSLPRCNSIRCVSKQPSPAGAVKSYSTPSAPSAPSVPDAAALAKELEEYEA